MVVPVAAGDKPALRPSAAEREPATMAEKSTLVLFVVGVSAVFLLFQLLGTGPPSAVEDECGASASAGSVQDVGRVSAAGETPPANAAAVCGDESGASDCDSSPLWSTGQTTAKPEPLTAAPPGC